MELRHIRYFLAVAEERNFTRAAARIGIGQPPLSQQIKDLEAEIGTALFHRVAHGAELTGAGEAFLKSVQAMPALAERGIQAARRAARGETGSLRVGFTGSATFNPVVPAAVRAFRRAYPDVALSLESSNTPQLIEHLRDGVLDAVFMRPGSPGCESLSLRVLSEEPMLLALPAAHQAVGPEDVAISLTDVRHDPFLLFPRAVGPTLFDTIITACRAAGFEPIQGQIAPQISAVVTLVSAELGVSLVPASISQLRIAGVAYRRIAGVVPTAQLALAHRKGDTNVMVRNFLAQAVS